MGLTVDQIIHLYRTEGATRYGMEDVSQEQHALQCGHLAEQAGASVQLVAAALLHDLGHLVHAESPFAANLDDRHEDRALPFLAGEYPAAVLQPVRLHVAAKRYLCGSEPAYWAGLSQASRRSLELQGGPFSPEQRAEFLGQPHALDALAVRRWDDQAKSPTRETPGWDHFRNVLERARVERVIA